MLKKILLVLLLPVVAGLAYLTLWPVPINPVAWNAPKSVGYVGKFDPNMRLANLKTLAIGEHHGPEDIAGRVENDRMIIYTSTQNGDIIRIDPVTNKHDIFAKTGGVALGLQFAPNGNLIVADAHKGLLSIDASGTVTVLTDKTDAGSPLLFTDELAIAADGKIYFSDASTKFGAKVAGSTLSGSLLELMEHGSTGRVLVYNPADKTTKTVADHMSFPNGIAMCPDDACILIAETGTYSIKRLWLKGLKAGIMDTVIENLPGFPDNINRSTNGGQDGRYWIGLTSPRSEALDNLSANPFMRKLVLRLPASLRPKAVNYGFVFAIDMNGKVLAQYQDPSGAYPLTTGATEPGDGWLYIGSLSADILGRKDLRGETF